MELPTAVMVRLARLQPIDDLDTSDFGRNGTARRVLQILAFTSSLTSRLGEATIVDSDASPFAALRGRSVLITGGTGTFGRAMTKTLLRQGHPDRLVIFSRDEMKQVEMSDELMPLDRDGVLRFFIGDVRDQRRLAMALRGINVVIHAAAMKQVPVAEYNPFECIHTNVLGAENVVQSSIDAGVDRVVALSTDKAVSPINLYGASKLCAEKIFVAANHLSGGRGPRFSVVRYGNVLGSRGSVVSVFRQLIAAGADYLPITDSRMTRFWITIRDGVAFVAACLARMKGGEIFVPKIPSMKLVDLATALAPHLEQRITGIRPGEKLDEVLITEDEARNTRDCGDSFIIEPALNFWSGPREKPGTEVPQNFRYSSNENERWLTATELLSMLNGASG
jgi:UDP-N-acetylglucosamine 4,6-dehydratase/5-epimerase